MTNGKFIKNTSWLISGQVLRMVISFFVGIISTRYLGPTNYGIINYVNSYIAFFTSLIGLGFSGIIVYEFVNHPEKNGEILGTAIFFRFVTGIFCTFVFLGIIYITDGNEQATMIVAILEAIQLPFLCLDTINYWYQAKLESKYPVIVQVIAHIVTSVYKIYLLITGKSVEWFGFALTLDIVVLGLSYLLVYLKQKGPRLRYSRFAAKRLLAGCGPFILANMMVVIYGQMDRVMIKQMLNSNTEVGLYSAALTICQLFGFLPIAILDSARPLIVEAKAKSEELFQLRFRQLVAGILWSCILFSIFVTIFSKYILSLLYGNAYLDANICLKIAVWYTTFSYLGSALHLWLICEEQNKRVITFCGLGALCNLVINFALIPILGINGAALATLITQLLTNFVFPLCFKKTRSYSLCVIDALLLKNINVKEMMEIVKARLPFRK